jgi:hypothetical protein
MTDMSSALSGTAISKMDRLVVSRGKHPSLASESRTGTGIDAGLGVASKPLAVAVAVAGTLKAGDVLTDVIGSAPRPHSKIEDQQGTIHDAGIVDRVMRPALAMPIASPLAASGGGARQSSTNSFDIKLEDGRPVNLKRLVGHREIRILHGWVLS